MTGKEPTQLNDSVFEFYRPDGEYNVEVIAFHGLCFADYRDAYKTTWDSKDGSGCWLRKFIPSRFPSARVLSVSYDSCAKVSVEAGRMSFSNIGKILVQDIIHLTNVGQQGCPVLMIGYCLGGLVIKQLCTEAERQYDQAPDGASKGRLEHFLTNVRVIAYLDTPHAGSSLGAYVSESEECHGPVLEYLTNSSPSLGKLNSDFDSLVFEREWYCSDTSVVEEESARRGQGTFFSIDANLSGKALRTLNQLDNFWKDLEEFLENIIQKTKISQHTGNEFTRSPTRIVNGDANEEQLNDSLYEMYRPVAEEDVKLELIFFPGSRLDGNCYKTTWMAEDNKHCWLQTWLSDVFPAARILAVSYGSYKKDAEIDLKLISENLIQNIILDKRRRSCGPLILVGHCFGGLVIKKLCDQVEQKLGEEAADLMKLKQFLSSIRGVVYYGTRHSGYGSGYKGQNLSSGGDENPWGVSDLSDIAVGRLNTVYMHFVTSLGWKELALVETLPTIQDSRNFILVDEFSASNGVQRSSFFPVAADHFSICKPKSPSSNSFQYLVHFIHTTIHEAQYRNMNVRRKKRRGVAVIIGKEGERPGSRIDRELLEDMVDYLQFEVFVVLDRKASEVRRVIESISENDLNDEDECIFCCVNDLGAVSDGIQLIFENGDNGIDLRCDILKPIADCPILAGKPKVFVINSSRTITCPSDATTDLKLEQNDLQGIDDCLLMYSTKLDTLALRQETGDVHGTLLVSELTDHVRLLYQTTDVEDIFRKVGKKVQELAERNEVKECPVLYSSLRKRLSWRPR